MAAEAIYMYGILVLRSKMHKPIPQGMLKSFSFRLSVSGYSDAPGFSFHVKEKINVRPAHSPNFVHPNPKWTTSDQKENVDVPQLMAELWT